jgi:hypothetical protein
VEDFEWQQFLFLFPTVKDIYLSGVSGLNVAQTLRRRDKETVTVEFSDYSVFAWKGFRHQRQCGRRADKPFVVTRQLSGYPVAIGWWEGMLVED